MNIEGFDDFSCMLRSGVYALGHKGKVVYIGKSRLMLRRIYQHRYNWGRAKKFGHPTWLPKGILFDEIFVRPCTLEQLDQLEYAMINLYKPRYNILLKEPTLVNEPFVVNIGKVQLKFNHTEAKPLGIERRV